MSISLGGWATIFVDCGPTRTYGRFDSYFSIHVYLFSWAWMKII